MTQQLLSYLRPTRVQAGTACPVWAKKQNCQVRTRVYVRVTVCLSAVMVCEKLLVCRLNRVSIGGAKHLSRPLFLFIHHCDQGWLVKENMIISQFIFISTLQLYKFKVFVLS